MMDNEELLFNELYEKTKDCGRTQFVRLLMEKDRENQELNKKYVNAVADYETTMAEKSELKKQLEELGGVDEYNRYLLNRQKEFIKWLEDKIKFSVKPTSRVLLKSILANYKEIIGVLDENN